MNPIEKMLNQQEALQVGSYGGVSPAELGIKEKLEFIRWNVLAAEDELHEALGETSWKPWADAQYINTEAFHSELVDVWHFFMNMMIATGMTAEDLEKGYEVKRAKNAKRMAEGYDGVSGKCPKCKRALDDNAVYCWIGDDRTVHCLAGKA